MASNGPDDAPLVWSVLNYFGWKEAVLLGKSEQCCNENYSNNAWKQILSSEINLNSDSHPLLFNDKEISSEILYRDSYRNNLSIHGYSYNINRRIFLGKLLFRLSMICNIVMVFDLNIISGYSIFFTIGSVTLYCLTMYSIYICAEELVLSEAYYSLMLCSNQRKLLQLEFHQNIKSFSGNFFYGFCFLGSLSIVCFTVYLYGAIIVCLRDDCIPSKDNIIQDNGDPTLLFFNQMFCGNRTFGIPLCSSLPIAILGIFHLIFFLLFPQVLHTMISYRCVEYTNKQIWDYLRILQKLLLKENKLFWKEIRPHQKEIELWSMQYNRSIAPTNMILCLSYLLLGIWFFIMGTYYPTSQVEKILFN